MTDIKDMSVSQIEYHLNNLKNDEYRKKRELERQAEEAFRAVNNIEIYEASDYCGLRNGEVQFYYGYEATYCPEHDDERICEAVMCEKREWCFTATKDGTEVLRLPTSKLWYINDAHIVWYLLSGIGQYLKADTTGTDMIKNSPDTTEG
jgi:hypothetical protein